MVAPVQNLIKYPSKDQCKELQTAISSLVVNNGTDKKQLQVINGILKNIFQEKPALVATFKQFEMIVKDITAVFAQPITNASIAKMRRMQQIMLDSLKIVEHMRITRPFAEYENNDAEFYDKFSKDICADNLTEVQKFVRKGFKPRSTIMGRNEPLIVPVAQQQQTQILTGLGSAAVMRAKKVMDYFLSISEDSNYAVQYPVIMQHPCQQSPFLPAWFGAATTCKLQAQEKLDTVTKLLDHGADPLLKDSDGNFWLTRCVEGNTFSPELMHLMLSRVDISKASRTNLEGIQVSLLDDLVEAFTTMSEKLRPKANSGIMALMQSAGMVQPGRIYRSVFGDSPTEALTKEEIEGTRKWQSDFLNNTAVMVTHGIVCSEALIQRINAQRKLSIPPSLTIIAEEDTVAAPEAIPIRASAYRTFHTTIDTLALKEVPTQLIKAYANDERLTIANYVFNQLFRKSAQG